MTEWLAALRGADFVQFDPETWPIRETFTPKIPWAICIRCEVIAEHIPSIELIGAKCRMVVINREFPAVITEYRVENAYTHAQTVGSFETAYVQGLTMVNIEILILQEDVPGLTHFDARFIWDDKCLAS